jgi:hypothetical protein
VVGYETMSDVNTGTGPFPTAGQQSGGLYMAKSSTADATARAWVIIADSKCFYMWVGKDRASVTGVLSTEYHPMFRFGDFYSYKAGDAYNCSIIGATTAVMYTEFGRCMANINASATVGSYAARSYTQTGGSVVLSHLCEVAMAAGTSSMGSSSYIAYPDPVSGAMLLARVMLVESGNIVRGHLHGVWNPLHNMPGSHADTFGGSGELLGKTFILLQSSAGGGSARVAIETSDW